MRQGTSGRENYWRPSRWFRDPCRDANKRPPKPVARSDWSVYPQTRRRHVTGDDVRFAPTATKFVR